MADKCRRAARRIPPGGAPAPRSRPACPARPAERLRPEGPRHAVAHGVDVDPDGCQRGPVEIPEHAVARHPDDLFLDAVRGDPVRAQHGRGRVIRASQGEQDVLAADVGMSQPERVLERAVLDRDDALGQTPKDCADALLTPRASCPSRVRAPAHSHGPGVALSHCASRCRLRGRACRACGGRSAS
jgi:hypothetical protein